MKENVVSGEKKTLIYTNSFDLSVDRIISSAGTGNFFRFNLDQWNEYKIYADSDTFTISNRCGNAISLDSTAKVLWRKPLSSTDIFRSSAREDRIVSYHIQEVHYAMQEIWNQLRMAKKAVLIDPNADSYCGKFLQSRVARDYFFVPQWKFILNRTEHENNQRRSVVKSLTGNRVNENRILYTTQVDEGRLALQEPWLVQDYVEASYDVTVVFVRNQLFAFQQLRVIGSKVVDCRYENNTAWERHSLPLQVHESVIRLMGRLNLHYGRLDFLLGQGGYAFLEVNPNGEWSWLDPEGEAGVLSKMVKEVSPFTPCDPLPAIGTYDLKLWEA